MDALRGCLVEWILERMEKKKKKKDKIRENFLEGVWLERGEGKEMAWVRPIKKFSPH